MRILSIVLLIALVAAPPAASQDVPAERANAADLYRVAWERHAEHMDAFRAELRRTGSEIVAPNWDLPEGRTRRVLKDCRPLIDELIRASRIEEADWGIDPDDPFVTLPHLLELRSSARLLAADARVRMVLGETDEAAERIAALFRMSLQLRSDRAGVSVSSAIEIFEAAALMAELFLDRARPTHEELRTIREAFEALPDDDPFEILNAIKVDRRRARGSIVLWGQVSEADVRRPPVIDELIRLAETFAVVVQFDRLDVMYQSVIDAWQSDDPSGSLDKIEEEIKAGFYGPLAEDSFQLMLSACRANLRVRSRIVDVRASLDGFELDGR